MIPTDIYNLHLHEEIEDQAWRVKRVPGGWIYYFTLRNAGIFHSTFVPLNMEFDNRPTPKIAPPPIK